MTTHSSPLQGLPGPASLSSSGWALRRGRWVDPVLPTRYTHPVYPPGTTPGTRTLPVHHRWYVGRSGVRGVRNSCSEVTVGEPRGVEYRGHMGPRERSGPIWHPRALVGARGRVIAPVLLSLVLSLLSLVPVLLSLVLSLLNLGPVLLNLGPRIDLRLTSHMPQHLVGPRNPFQS